MIRITDTIYLIPGRNKGRFPYCHCFYIRDEVNVLIDSAAGEEALLPLLGRVDLLINTHYHVDHIRGNNLFPKARILCHPADRPPLESLETFLYYTGFGCFNRREWEAVSPILQYRESKVSAAFTDGEVLDFGRTKLRVIHTPGHSPGHCCLYAEKEDLLFGADVDLTAFGPWYGHHLANLEDFERSMQIVMAVEAGRFLSSHEEACITENVSQRLADYAAVFTARDRLILETLQNPHTLEELTSKMLIYPRHPEPVHLFRFFEKTMLEKHLNKLELQGRVIRRGTAYRSK
jgi:glyoxylase-like metal-dependent hydrolase (beta-lactamase superfamily II)